jgi:two-component system NarL family sensor kinase
MDTQEARIFIAIVISAVLLGVIIFYFALTMIRQQKRNLALQKANIIAEFHAMERERSRIAADLHDDLGPVMSVVKFQVDYAKQSDVVETEQLAKASESLDSMIERMREIANNLMPSALQRKGLIPALQEFFVKAESAGKLVIHFECNETIQLNEDQQLQIYRTIQELIHNCIKHAKATTVDLMITEERGELNLLYTDNGIGFDIDRVSKGASGIGLKSLRNRTQILGGEMTVESKEGKGTAFLFRLPLR